MEKLEKFGYVAANIYFSGSCNLECTYCFQPKIGEHMAEVNKKIIEWISSGKMEDDLEKYIGSNIQILTLWGGEPSINLPYLVDRLPFILDRFPKLKEISYSTNMSTRKLTENTLNLLLKSDELSNKLNRKFKCNVQISIDGVPKINDANRIGSSANKIVDNITWMLHELVNHNFDKNKVIFTFKGTQGSFSLKYLSEGNHLYEHYKYFDDLYTEWSKICNYYPRGGEHITLVYPGQYTQEDGYIFKKITKTLLSETFRKNDWNNKLDFETQVSSRIRGSIEKTFKAHNRPYKGEWISNSVCSAGRSCAGITYDGMYHWCQATYFFDKETRKYIRDNNLVTDFEANQGFSFRNFDRFVDNVETAKYNDDLSLSRSLMVPSVYRESPETRISYIDMMIFELASAGLISECFKDDTWRKLAINYIIFGGNECIANNVWEFGSIWIKTPATFKLVFNGAFEEIINSIKGNKND